MRQTHISESSPSTTSFEGASRGDGSSFALMETLTDPMLKQCVPAWVKEQYERAKPFCREVLTCLA